MPLVMTSLSLVNLIKNLATTGQSIERIEITYDLQAKWLVYTTVYRTDTGAPLPKFPVSRGTRRTPWPHNYDILEKSASAPTI
jgi:hypothetical protein